MSYQEKKNQLKGLIKNAPETPVQRISPVKKGDWHLNIWLDSGTEMRVKTYALHSKKSIKEITTEALEEYLSKRS